MHGRKAGRLLAALASCVAACSATAADAPSPYWPPISDPPTANHTPGKWVWAELLTRDVGTAVEFYGQVFGWTFETFGPKDDRRTYTLVSSQGVPIAGMVFVDPKERDGQPTARWVGLMSVEDVALAEGRVVNGGGRVLMAPRQLGARGTAALFADPEGAVFGVIRSATGDPQDYVGDENAWLWIELWANDAAAMAKFYQPLGGYQVLDGAAAGERSGFQLASGGYARAGILPKPIPAKHTAWIPYVRVRDVTDTVSRARAAGARVVIEPREAHGTRAALLLDPTGAPFAVAEWNRK